MESDEPPYHICTYWQTYIIISPFSSFVSKHFLKLILFLNGAVENGNDNCRWVTDAADNLETGVFDKIKNTVVTFKASEDL